MKEYEAYTKEVPGGWRVMFRFGHDAYMDTLRGKGGIPKTYNDQVSAYSALTNHLLNFINGRVVTGELPGAKPHHNAARERAEQFFKKMKG